MLKYILNVKNSILHTGLFIGYWLLCGGLQVLFFIEEDPTEVSSWKLLGISFDSYFPGNEENYVSWVRDYVGHWLAMFAFVVSLSLNVSISRLSNLSPEIAEKSKRRFAKLFPVLLVVTFLVMGGFTYQNFDFVMNGSKIKHWSSLSSSLFALMNPLIFYFLVMGPLMLNILFYLFLLNDLSNDIYKVNGFGPFNLDKMYGLKAFGRSIFWNILAIAVASFPLVFFQLYQKEALSIGNFASISIVFLLFWSICLKPLINVSFELFDYKTHSAQTIDYSIRLNEQEQGRFGPSVNQQQAAKEIEMLKLKAQELQESKVIPLNNYELFIGALILFLLLIQVGYGTL